MDGSSFSHGPFVIGAAHKKGKAALYVTPLQEVASKHSIQLVEIDPTRPLEPQGPFHAIIHKVPGDEWKAELKAYMRDHPEVMVADPPEALEKVAARENMLDDIAAMHVSIPGQGEFLVPKQVVVPAEAAASDIKRIIADAGLKPPLVVKPLFSDSSVASHSLLMLNDIDSIALLQPPVLLQQFVNHGGVMLKVYVAGESVVVDERPSLPDARSTDSGLVPFGRVSAGPEEATGPFLPPPPAASTGAPTELLDPPPEILVKSLTDSIQQKLGLTLFNLDIIRASENKDQYYVIDINYFPGFFKLPGYKDMLLEYMKGLAARRA